MAPLASVYQSTLSLEGVTNLFSVLRIMKASRKGRRLRKSRIVALGKLVLVRLFNGRQQYGVINMRNLIPCLVLGSFAFLATAALSQQINNLTEVTTPTQVGTTTIPSGTYVMTDETTGKTYPLIITKNGTMVLGPAGSATQEVTSLPTKKSSLKTTLERNVSSVIEREGISGLEKFIK
jgi:hypothetical protein